jgi:RNA polymerase sigma factor (TIGR02999 family)
MTQVSTDPDPVEGDLTEIFPAVYEDLRRLAARRLRQQRHPTLQPTALVHDLFVRLAGQPALRFGTRAQFFALASRAMRAVLCDRARARAAAKRGAALTLSLDDVAAGADSLVVEALALDIALTRLEAIDVRQARIVELRYFGGLTVEETAETLVVSPMTIKREWRIARAWLRRELGEALQGPAEATPAAGRRALTS